MHDCPWRDPDGKDSQNSGRMSQPIQRHGMGSIKHGPTRGIHYIAVMCALVAYFFLKS